MNAEERIQELGIDLPTGGAPVGNYVSVVQTGTLLFTSGRAPLPVDGRTVRGRLGLDYSTDQGYALARSACIDLLGVLKHHLGTLDRVARFVELHGTLCTTSDFEDHAKVLDGASDLLVSVFGPDGVHVRSAIGVTCLRNGVPLTIKATIEVVQES